MKTLDSAKNMYGSLSNESKKRVIDYINEPTKDKWTDISSIIVKEDFTTIWERVIRVKPSMKNQGRVYDSDWNVVKDWEEIPTPLEVLRAIK